MSDWPDPLDFENKVPSQKGPGEQQAAAKGRDDDDASSSSSSDSEDEHEKARNRAKRAKLVKMAEKVLSDQGLVKT
jgi:hypothetical protein